MCVQQASRRAKRQGTAPQECKQDHLAQNLGIDEGFRVLQLCALSRALQPGRGVPFLALWVERSHPQSLPKLQVSVSFST